MVRAPDRCMGGHGLDFRWYSLFLFSHARNKVVVVGGGDRGTGARENRGREGYGRRESKGREVGVPKGREAGEIGGNYVTLCNISQSKKDKREEAKKKGAGARIARYGRWEVWTSLSPPPPTK